MNYLEDKHKDDKMIHVLENMTNEDGRTGQLYELS
jgi:hypothetical protein